MSDGNVRIQLTDSLASNFGQALVTKLEQIRKGIAGLSAPFKDLPKAVDRFNSELGETQNRMDAVKRSASQLGSVVSSFSKSADQGGLKTFNAELGKLKESLGLIDTSLSRTQRSFGTFSQSVTQSKAQVLNSIQGLNNLGKAFTDTSQKTQNLVRAEDQVTQAHKRHNQQLREAAALQKRLEAETKKLAAAQQREAVKAANDMARAYNTAAIAAGFLGGAGGRLVSNFALLKGTFAGQGAAATILVGKFTAVAASINGLVAVTRLAAQGITTAFSAVTETFGEFQQQVVNASAVMTGSLGAVQEISERARKTALDFRISSSELAQSFTILGQSGFTLEESLGSIRSIAELSQATLTDMKVSTDLTTTAIRAFADQNVNASQAANAFVAGVTNSKLTISGLATSFNFVAVSAAKAGVSLEETVALLGTMADRGLKASTSATGLRGVLGELLAPTERFKSQLQAVGLSLSDIDVRSIGIVQVLRNMRDAGFDVADAYAAFDKRIAAAATTLVQNVDSIEQLTGRVTDTAEATRIAALQMDTWQGRLKILSNVVENFALELGDAVDGQMKRFLDSLIELAENDEFLEFVKASMGIILDFGTAVARVADEYLTGLGIAFRNVQRVIQSFSEPVLNAVQNIQTLATAVQTVTSRVSGLKSGVQSSIGTTEQFSDRLQTLANVVKLNRPILGSLIKVLAEFTDIQKEGKDVDKGRREELQQLVNSYRDLDGIMRVALKTLENEKSSAEAVAQSRKEITKALLDNKDILSELTEEQLESIATGEDFVETVRDISKEIETIKDRNEFELLSKELLDTSGSLGVLTSEIDKTLQKLVETGKASQIASQGLSDQEVRTQLLSEATEGLTESLEQQITANAENLVALSQSSENAELYRQTLEGLLVQARSGTVAQRVLASSILDTAAKADSSRKVVRDLGSSYGDIRFQVDSYSKALDINTSKYGENAAKAKILKDALSGSQTAALEFTQTINTQSAGLTSLAESLTGVSEKYSELRDIVFAFSKDLPQAFVSAREQALEYRNTLTENLIPIYHEFIDTIRNSQSISTEFYVSAIQLAEELATREGESVQRSRELYAELYAFRTTQLQQQTNEILESYQDEIQALADLQSQYEQGQISSEEYAESKKEITDRIKEAKTALEENVLALKTLTEAEIKNAQESIKYWEQRKDAIDKNTSALEKLLEKNQKTVDSLKSTVDSLKEAGTSTKTFAQQASAAVQAQQNLRKAASEFNTELNTLNARYRSGEITTEEYTEEVKRLETEYGNVNKKSKEVEKELQKLEKALPKDAAKENTEEFQRYKSVLSGTRNATRELERVQQNLKNSIDKSKAASKAAGDQIEAFKEQLNGTQKSVVDLAKQMEVASKKVSEFKENISGQIDTKALSKANAEVKTVKGSVDQLAKTAGNVKFDVTGIEEEKQVLNQFYASVKPQITTKYDLDITQAMTNLDAIQARIDALNAAASSIGAGGDGGGPSSGGPGFRYGGAIGGGHVGSGKQYGGGDKVFARLEPGEFVLRKEAARGLGLGLLNKINRYGKGHKGGYQRGGLVLPKDLEEELRILEAATSSSNRYKESYSKLARLSIQGAEKVAEVASTKFESQESQQIRKAGDLLSVLNDSTLFWKRSFSMSNSSFSDARKSAGLGDISSPTEKNSNTSDKFKNFFSTLESTASSPRSSLPAPSALNASDSVSLSLGELVRKVKQDSTSVKKFAAFSRSSSSVGAASAGISAASSPSGGGFTGGGGESLKQEYSRILAEVLARYDRGLSESNPEYSALNNSQPFWKQFYETQISQNGVQSVASELPGLEKDARKFDQDPENLGRAFFDDHFSARYRGAVSALNTVLSDLAGRLRSELGINVRAPSLTSFTGNLTGQISKFMADIDRAINQQINQFQFGGMVDGSGVSSLLTGSEVPAKLEAGEFVLNNKTVKAIGAPILNAWNKSSNPSDLIDLVFKHKYHTGGLVTPNGPDLTGAALPSGSQAPASGSITVNMNTMSPDATKALIYNDIIPELERWMRRGGF